MSDPRTQASRVQRDTGGVSRGGGGGDSTAWVFFAGFLLFMVGAFNTIFGLSAVFQSSSLQGPENALLVSNYTAWGWLHFAIGVLMIMTGLGLFSGAGWARWVAVLFVMVNAITQVGFITAYPLWSLLIIALDVVILYHLTVRWDYAEKG